MKEMQISHSLSSEILTNANYSHIFPTLVCNIFPQNVLTILHIV